MTGPILRQIDSLRPVQDGVRLSIILLAGTSFLLENAAAIAIKKLRKSVDDLANKMYNKNDGAELDSISLEDYLGN